MNRCVIACYNQAPKLTLAQIPAFERVYDALDTYKRKSEMSRLPATDLRLGDIVLAEFYVTRWIPKEEVDENVSVVGTSNAAQGKKKGNANKPGKKEWKAWNVEFKLDAVSLLVSGGDHYDGHRKPDEDVEF